MIEFESNMKMGNTDVEVLKLDHAQRRYVLAGVVKEKCGFLTLTLKKDDPTDEEILEVVEFMNPQMQFLLQYAPYLRVVVKSKTKSFQFSALQSEKPDVKMLKKYCKRELVSIETEKMIQTVLERDRDR